MPRGGSLHHPSRNCAVNSLRNCGPQRSTKDRGPQPRGHGKPGFGFLGQRRPSAAHRPRPSSLDNTNGIDWHEVPLLLEDISRQPLIFHCIDTQRRRRVAKLAHPEGERTRAEKGGVGTTKQTSPVGGGTICSHLVLYPRRPAARKALRFPLEWVRVSISSRCVQSAL